MATNGSIGEGLRIEVGEHIYITPPVPPKENILYYDKKKADQYWRRQTDIPQIFYQWSEEVEIDAEFTEYNDDGSLKSLNKTDTDEVEYYRDREMERRRYGVWFYNNGEPTYINGDHYFSLQWGAMLGCENFVEPGSNYGQYYQFQRDDIFYYFEICENTEYGLGGIMVKPKKTGATQAVSLILLNRASMIEQKNIRMMSITEDLCKDANFNLILYAISKMPAILIPSRSKQNLGEVVFGPPNGAKNPLKKKRELNKTYLNTWLCTVATRDNGFDSFTNYIAWIDEFPKIKETATPKKLFEISKAAVKEGFRRKGTLFATSYVPEFNDTSFDESKIIYWGSKLSTIKEGSTTTASKLICHTLTIDKGLFACCDKYGKPIAELITKAVAEEIANCNGDEKKIQAVKRQYPTSENDPWLEGWGAETLFRNLKLDEQRQHIAMHQAKGMLFYEEFNLDFSIPPTIDDIKKDYRFPGDIRLKRVSDDDIRDGRKGKFKWFRKEWLPPDFVPRNTNKCTISKKNGKLMPDPHSPFYSTIDPANYAISKNVVVGSKNAFQVFLLPDSSVDAYCGVRNASFKRLMVSYLFREEKPVNTLLDAIMMILYFSCYLLIESNTSWLFNRLIEMGFENFLIVRNVNTGVFEPFDAYKMMSGEQQMYSVQKNAVTNDIDYYVKAGQDHYGEPFADGEVDNIELQFDIDVIDQLIRFNKGNTRAFDAGVCNLTGLMGINSYLGWRQKELQGKEVIHEGLRGVFANYVR